MRWALLLGSFAALAWAYAPFESDDSYITLALARGLVEAGVPTLGGDTPVAAISSPLWFLLAVLAQALDDPWRAAHALRAASAGFSLLSVVLAWRLLQRLEAPRSSALIVTLLLAVDPWFGRWIVGGLEAPAALCVVFGSLCLRWSPRPVSRLAAPLLAGSVGVLVRPELGLLAILLALDLLRREPRLPSSVGVVRCAGLLLAAALPVLAWSALSWSWFELLLPSSARVKAGALDPATAGLRALSILATGQGVALLGLLLSPRTGPEDRPRPLPLLLLWPGVLVAFYALQGYEPLSRYLLPGSACLAVAAALKLPAAGGRICRGVLVLAIAAGVAVTGLRSLPASSGDSCHFYRECLEWIEENGQQGEAVATWEIGTLAWFGKQPLVDLGGLALPPQLLSLQPSPRRLLRATRPRYSLLHYSMEGVRFEAVYSRPVRRSRASRGTAEDDLTLYRLDWDAP